MNSARGLCPRINLAPEQSISPTACYGSVPCSAAFLLSALIHGQDYMEYRSARRKIIGPDAPVVRLHDFVGNRQTHADAALLCGKERLEQVRQAGRFDSGT